MLNFEQNYNIPANKEEEFLKLDLRDKYKVNKWLKSNQSLIDEIEGDYIIYNCWNRCNEYLDYVELNLGEFVEKYISNIKKDNKNGLDVVVLISDGNGEVEYNGILEIDENESVYIIDRYGSQIKITDGENLKVDRVNVIKRIKKTPALITVKDFLILLEDSIILNNALITLYLHCGSTRVIYLKNTYSGKVASLSASFNQTIDIGQYENYLIDSFKVNYC